jgi:hypothetical protein
MRGTRLQVAKVGATLLVAGVLAAGSPPGSGFRVEVPPGLGGETQSLDLKPEDVPPPGACRLWYPDRKPAEQPPPGPCAQLTRNIPAGAWVLHRAPNGKRLVRVH